jgi:hypothetical protein
MAGVLTALACLLVWFALVGPDEAGRLTPIAFVRIPLEGLVVVTLVIVLPQRARRIVAVLVGVVLGVLAVLKILDMGFFAALSRPFNPAIDWTYFGSAEGALSDSIGSPGAIAAVVLAVLLAVALLVLTPLAVLRLTRILDRHRTSSTRAVTALGVVWILLAALGVQVAPGAQVASTSAARLAYDRATLVGSSIRDERSFAHAVKVDPRRNTPAKDLLTGLRGKDVLITFVESYGRSAVEGSSFSPQVDSVLDAGTKRLRAAGFSSQSGYLRSPTFGGLSWLAHSTLQSGLWIDNQLRYNDVVKSNHFTLSDAFKRAGWRTVGDVPSNYRKWPQGKSFYHYDKLYGARNVGYAGPKFSYEAMPDQYIWSAFRRRELAKPHHTPVMAEIDLVSSHSPWTPLPHMVDWKKVGDGSIFDNQPAQGEPPDVVFRDPDQVRASYGRSVQYSLTALFSFLQTYHDKNLVLVVLGDHQPARIVSGSRASHDVPISIIAHDPAVMKRISGWGWQDGMRPAANSPVWPMDAFRDRFLTAYGPHPPSARH